MVAVPSMYKFQATLSEAQAIPIIGPAVVSPCKAVVSLAQIIVGLAGGIIFGALTVLTRTDWCAGKTMKSIGHVGMGCLAFGYSIINILTLGIAAYQLESFRADPDIRDARNRVLG